MSLFKGPKISKFNAHFIANNIACRLIRDDLTIEHFLRNVEQYLENEIINVCKDCSIEAHESREIAQLIGFIMTEHYETFKETNKVAQDLDLHIKKEKDKGVYYKEYPSNWIDRRIFLINLMHESVIKEFFDYEDDDSYPLNYLELDLLTPILMINNKTQNKYLKSFENNNSILENIKKIFSSNDSKKTASDIVNSGSISQELINLVCIRSSGKLSPEHAQSFIIKNRVRKLSGINNTKQIIIKIKSDFPHLSEQESNDLLKFV